MAFDGFEYDTSGAGDERLVTARGEIDASTARGLAAALDDVLDTAPAVTLTVDLGDVSFLDSTGLGVLVKAKKRAEAGGGDIVLANVPDRIVRILEITSLTQVFRLV